MPKFAIRSALANKKPYRYNFGDIMKLLFQVYSYEAKHKLLAWYFTPLQPCIYYSIHSKSLFQHKCSSLAGDLLIHTCSTLPKVSWGGGDGRGKYVTFQHYLQFTFTEKSSQLLIYYQPQLKHFKAVLYFATRNLFNSVGWAVIKK